jgi:hypothetical protein
VTTQGGDILAWLETAITARETAAREAAEATDASWTDGGTYGESVHTKDHGYTVAVGPWGDMDDEVRFFIAANDPASVLRRCATDRKLLELHAPTKGYNTHGGSYTACSACGTSEEYPVRFPCPTVRVVAEGYGWTGDER